MRYEVLGSSKDIEETHRYPSYRNGDQVKHDNSGFNHQYQSRFMPGNSITKMSKHMTAAYQNGFHSAHYEQNGNGLAKTSTLDEFLVPTTHKKPETNFTTPSVKHQYLSQYYSNKEAESVAKQLRFIPPTSPQNKTPAHETVAITSVDHHPERVAALRRASKATMLPAGGDVTSPVNGSSSSNLSAKEPNQFNPRVSANRQPPAARPFSSQTAPNRRAGFLDSIMSLITSTRNLLFNETDPNCQCRDHFRAPGETKPTCPMAMKWLQQRFNESELPSLKESFNKLKRRAGCERSEEHTKQIKKDLERTFPTSPSFQVGSANLESLETILNTYAKYDPQIGYVQGMNFIAGSLLYHAEEYIAFWLVVAVTEMFEMRDIYLPGNFSCFGTPTNDLILL